MTKQLALGAVIAAIAATSLTSVSVIANETDSGTTGYNPSIKSYASPYLSSVNMDNGIDGAGFGVRLGYKLTDSWGVVGDASIYQLNGNPKEDFEKPIPDYDGWMFSVGPSYYINERLNVFATVGMAKLSGANYTYGNTHRTKELNHQIQQTVDVTKRDNENINPTDDKTVVYGVGINYALSNYFLINASYKRFTPDLFMSDVNSSESTDLLEVGCGFRF
ncbi:outer membrane beta-barrel protein [Vibrio sp. 1159]|uniref:outer membrane beta-barrel protein n=1 Tax=Vibrio sp. 1159 TaxID=3074545 RepID=UPI0029649211|nr:outer membrane beta-barrel protein [Vibrio sp. 1159]MDW2322681.1 outer membrane beta-barrel protein [Vibrio sp. 1159]